MGSRLGVALVASACTALALGGIALATDLVADRTPAAAPKMNGCANKQTGALRLANRCKKTERKVSWAIVGPVGPKAPELLAGSVAFVDALDTDGFIGLGGLPAVQPAAADAGSELAVGAVLSGFRANARGFATGTVTVNVLRSTTGVDGTYTPTGITCGLTSAPDLLPDTAHSAAFAAGDYLAVEIVNPTGTFLRNVRWTASYR